MGRLSKKQLLGIFSNYMRVDLQNKKRSIASPELMEANILSNSFPSDILVYVGTRGKDSVCVLALASIGYHSATSCTFVVTAAGRSGSKDYHCRWTECEGLKIEQVNTPSKLFEIRWPRKKGHFQQRYGR